MAPCHAIILPCLVEIDVHAELKRVVFAPEGVVERRRRGRSVEVRVPPPRVLILRVHGYRQSESLQDTRLVFDTGSEREAGNSRFARRAAPPTDVLVLVEPAHAGYTIDKYARQHYAPHLQTPGGAPMRRGADETSACEGVIDGLVQIIELGERT